MFNIEVSEQPSLNSSGEQGANLAPSPGSAGCGLFRSSLPRPGTHSEVSPDLHEHSKSKGQITKPLVGGVSPTQPRHSLESSSRVHEGPQLEFARSLHRHVLAAEAAKTKFQSDIDARWVHIWRQGKTAPSARASSSPALASTLKTKAETDRALETDSILQRKPKGHKCSSHLKAQPLIQPIKLVELVVVPTHVFLPG